MKKNQPTLYAAVEAYAQTEATAIKNLVSDYFDNAHSRNTRRRYFTFSVTDEMKALGFTDMSTVIATETISSSKYKEGTEAESRYYIPATIQAAIFYRYYLHQGKAFFTHNIQILLAKNAFPWHKYC